MNGHSAPIFCLKFFRQIFQYDLVQRTKSLLEVLRQWINGAAKSALNGGQYKQNCSKRQGQF
jgi:hypothetical protein